jgi:hypothetical protein
MVATISFAIMLKPVIHFESADSNLSPHSQT